jgi:hypothetical protein
MKHFINAFAGFLVIFFSCLKTFGQTEYDLPARVRHHLLIPAKPSCTINILDTSKIPAVRCTSLYWLAGASFSEGTIDVDLRGNDSLLQSFLGIAFHGVDSSTYDVVYFRPFNFRNPDTARHNWGVQYMSLPWFPFDKLRAEHPLMYEHAVNPVPFPEDWFHARIVVARDSITVYVNHSEEISLKVPILISRHVGRVGLWSDGLPEDFANLTITGGN